MIIHDLLSAVVAPFILCGIFLVCYQLGRALAERILSRKEKNR